MRRQGEESDSDSDSDFDDLPLVVPSLHRTLSICGDPSSDIFANLLDTAHIFVDECGGVAEYHSQIAEILSDYTPGSDSTPQVILMLNLIISVADETDSNDNFQRFREDHAGLIEQYIPTFESNDTDTDSYTSSGSLFGDSEEDRSEFEDFDTPPPRYS